MRFHDNKPRSLSTSGELFPTPQEFQDLSRDDLQHLIAGFGLNGRNNQGQTLLMLAAQAPAAPGATARLKQLITAGSSLTLQDYAGFTPLMLSITSNSNQHQHLIQAGAPLEQRSTGFGYTALHVAMHHSNDAVIETLVTAGADVNATCKLGMTPLHFAAQRSTLFATDLLIKAGARVHAPSKRGVTPLMAAATNDTLDNTLLLLRHTKEHINYADSINGNTALNYAIAHWKPHQLKLLLHHGANPNHRDMLGLTPLMQLADRDATGEMIHGFYSINHETPTEYVDQLLFTLEYANMHPALILLSEGCNPESRDRSDRTALDLARGFNNDPMIQILENYTPGKDPQ